MAGVQVSFEALTQAIHAEYGRQIAALVQRNAELTAGNDALMAERDHQAERAEYFSTLTRPTVGPPPADAYVPAEQSQLLGYEN